MALTQYLVHLLRPRRSLVIASAISAILFMPSIADAQTKAWIWSKRDLRKVAKLEREVTEKEGMFRVEGKTWIAQSQVDARFTAELCLFMEVFQTAFDDLLKGLHEGSKFDGKPVVTVWASEARYKQDAPGGSRGYFDYNFGGDGKLSSLRVFSFIDEPEEREFKFFYYPILIHEGAHCALQGYVGKADVPLWFDEGIATYFQFWDLRASGSKNLKTRFRRSFYNDNLKKIFLESPPSLRMLRGVATWNPDKMGPIAQRNYTLAESFVDLLLSSKRGREHFKAIFQRIIHRKPALPDDDVDALERAWHAHIKQRFKL